MSARSVLGKVGALYRAFDMEVERIAFLPHEKRRRYERAALRLTTTSCSWYTHAAGMAILKRIEQRRAWRANRLPRPVRRKGAR